MDSRRFRHQRRLWWCLRCSLQGTRFVDVVDVVDLVDDVDTEVHSVHSVHNVHNVHKEPETRIARSH